MGVKGENHTHPLLLGSLCVYVCKSSNRPEKAIPADVIWVAEKSCVFIEVGLIHDVRPLWF